MNRRHWLATLLMACVPGAQAADPPGVMQARPYQPGIDLRDHWVSEKLDGVRARWDGGRLLTRGGLALAAPDGFTAGWPRQALDGELWIGRGAFERTVSTVRQQTPDPQAWQHVRFMVFDLPDHPGTFGERLQAMAALVQALDQPWVRLIEQTRGSTHAELMQQLDRVVRAGGEGLMLHRDGAHYQARRSDDLLKVKPHEDAEAQVVAHVPGQGRHAGRLGALRVRTADGRVFQLGSGLSDALRQQPPAVGTWVTYRFRGLHGSGLPRFATFVRVRADADLNGGT
jgi:DNA ligase-1